MTLKTINKKDKIFTRRAGGWLGYLLFLVFFSYFSLAGEFTTPLFSLEDTPKEARVIADILNIRDIPSSGGSVVGSLKKGRLISIITKSKGKSKIQGKEAHWYKIKIPKKKKVGWVFGAFISFDTAANSGLKWNNIDINSKYTFKTMANSGRHVIAGAESGVLFISSDQGKSWKKKVPQVLGVKIGKIHKIFTENKKIWIAASGEKQGGVWLTTNTGSSWSQFTKIRGLPSNDIYDIIKKGKTLWAATSQGVVYSKNFGLKWQRIPKDTFDKPVTSVEVFGSKAVFAGTEDGLFQLKTPKGLFSNGKKSWVQIGEDKPNMGDEIKSLKLYKSSYLLIGTDEGACRVDMKTLSKWTPLGGEDGINKIHVDTQNRIFITTDEGLHISSDHGLSWIAYTEKNGLESDETQETTVSSDGVIWVSLGEDGIASSKGL